MKKASITAIFGLTLVALPILVQAQMYPYQYQYQQPYSYPLPYQCQNLTRLVSLGASDASVGGEVSVLQRALQTRGYLGASDVSGYFGQTTASAVRNFQRANGIPVSGVVGELTRNALNRDICNQTPYPSYPSPTYNVNLTSLSPVSGQAGTQMTIYGSGFDAYGNTVKFGNTNATTNAYSNGNSLTVTVPFLTNGSYPVTVTNSRGTSNALSFAIQSGIVYGCTYGYGYNYLCPQGLSLTTLSPNNGGVGTSVTVFGSGFSREGNTVQFGNAVIANRRSIDGYSLSFEVPSYLIGYGSYPITLGTYDVSVTNAQGQRSNSLPFTVTTLGSTNAPTISYVSGPNTLGAGVQGTWSVTISAASGQYLTTQVQWGDSYAYAPQSGVNEQSTYITGQQTLSFSHAYAQAGTYNITFTVRDQYGRTNISTATVTVTGTSSSQITVNSISPTYGPTGVQLTIYGSGFSQWDNVVHFGTGGQRNIPSYNNGSVIYYTVPQWISPCDPHAQFCTMVAQQVMPGQYAIRVSNANGSQFSNTNMFTVTQ